MILTTASTIIPKLDSNACDHIYLLIVIIILNQVISYGAILLFVIVVSMTRF